MKLIRTRNYVDNKGKEIEIGIIGDKILLVLETEWCYHPCWTAIAQIGSVGLFYLSFSLGSHSFTMTVLGRNYG